MGMMRALYHWIRLWYYVTALNHVGPSHPDASFLTMCCIDSQRVVDDFLNERPS
jgi:hypothetical protein